MIPVVTIPVCLGCPYGLSFVWPPYEESVGGGKSAHLLEEAWCGVVELHAGAADGHHNERLLRGYGDAQVLSVARDPPSDTPHSSSTAIILRHCYVVRVGG